MRWGVWGVRARVTAAASLVLASIMVIGAIVLVSLVNQSLQDNLDAAAVTRAQDVAATLTTNGVRSSIATGSEDSSLVQVVDSTGAVVSASENISGEPAVLALPPSTYGSVSVTVGSVPVGANAQLFRVVAEPVQLPSGAGWVYVASSLEQVESATGSLVLLLSIGLPIMLVIVGGTIWFAVGRALRPVESIRSRAVEIRADLSQRVPVPAANDEIGRLARTVNEMLDRLAAAAEEERRFVGDASHELRSPLAAIRSQVDVALEHPGNMDPLTVLATVQKQTVQMAHLLDDLLFLARISEPPSTHGESTVDLDEIVLNEAHRLQRRSGDVAVHLGHLDAARIPGSARDLARLVANLGDNALHYARTEVRVELFSTPGALAIVVTDDGPGIAVEDRERVFDRFTQLEDARSRSVPAPGAGLGLAIAQQIAARHGGTITVGERGDETSGTVMRVTLPPVVPG